MDTCLLNAGCLHERRPLRQVFTVHVHTHEFLLWHAQAQKCIKHTEKFIQNDCHSNVFLCRNICYTNIKYMNKDPYMHKDTKTEQYFGISRTVKADTAKATLLLERNRKKEVEQSSSNLFLYIFAMTNSCNFLYLQTMPQKFHRMLCLT